MAYSPELLILLRLLAAHLLADFLLQPRSWIEQRYEKGIRSAGLYYHVAVVGLLTYLLLGDWSHAGLPAFILVTHWAIDWWKSTQPRSTRAFVIDQAAHLLMLLAAWIVYTGMAAGTAAFFSHLLASSTFWIVVVSYIAVIWPAGYLIGSLTVRWQKQVTDAGDSEDGYTGLRQAGMWIGRLERLLILTFILMQQYSAIGFLIAAKSVFRFSGKLEGSRERKEAEYILIGTLLSFALAIILGIGTRYLLNVM